MTFMGLKRGQKRQLEAEVVSNDARVKLTRLIRKACQAQDPSIEIGRQNRFINLARTVQAMPLYKLESDDLGDYEPAEFSWHSGELELVTKRPDTAQLVEILGDILQAGYLDLASVNEILTEDNVSVRFKSVGFDDDVAVEVLSDQEIEEEAAEADHPNIRLLISRMEADFERSDYAGVLHASASIFETLAKLVFNTPTVESSTLGGIFEGYKNRSALPGPVLDYIKDTYDRRNTAPLAGHGATLTPNVTREDAATLIEMTKMCVRLERRLSAPEAGL